MGKSHPFIADGFLYCPLGRFKERGKKKVVVNLRIFVIMILWIVLLKEKIEQIL